MYSEVKTAVCFSLTRTAVSKLDELANVVNLSRSELIEQIARGIIDIKLDKILD